MQYSAEPFSQEEPHAAKPLHSFQEGPAHSGLQRLEQAKAVHPGPASAPAARVRRSQMCCTEREHTQSVCKEKLNFIYFDVVNKKRAVYALVLTVFSFVTSHTTANPAKDSVTNDLIPTKLKDFEFFSFPFLLS